MTNSANYSKINQRFLFYYGSQTNQSHPNKRKGIKTILSYLFWWKLTNRSSMKRNCFTRSTATSLAAVIKKY